MSTVINRTTKQVVESANTPDYPVEDWIINPDLSAVAGVDSGWWVIVGDTVREATPAEKNANLSWYKSAVELRGYKRIDEYLVDSDRIDAINSKAVESSDTAAIAHIAPYITWRDSVYSYMVTLAGQLGAAVDIAAVDVIVSGFDLTQFDATRPAVTYESSLGALHGIG